jgi:hypothetical protein
MQWQKSDHQLGGLLIPMWVGSYRNLRDAYWRHPATIGLVVALLMGSLCLKQHWLVVHSLNEEACWSKKRVANSLLISSMSTHQMDVDLVHEAGTNWCCKVYLISS